jgi:hypothetical protein
MPSTDEATGIGPTYEFVAALYGAAVLTTVATTAAVLAEAPGDVVVMVVGFGGLGLATVVGVAVGVVGLPRQVHPRPLYASGRSWGPAVVGVVSGTVAFPVLLADVSGVVAVGETRTLLAASFGGFVIAGVGWVVHLMARNAEARARLAASEEVLKWRARPAPRRRRLYYAVAGVSAVLAVGTGLLVGDWWTIGVFSGGISLAARGANEQWFRLADDTLVYGNPQVSYLLDRDEIRAVTHSAEEIRVERRGFRPALTCDTTEIDDPEAVVAALTSRGTRRRPR